jgi:hypothetical protein
LRPASDVLQRDRTRNQECVVGEYREDREGIEEEPVRPVCSRLSAHAFGTAARAVFPVFPEMPRVSQADDRFHPRSKSWRLMPQQAIEDTLAILIAVKLSPIVDLCEIPETNRDPALRLRFVFVWAEPSAPSFRCNSETGK